jgi:hypothetical protein
MFEKVGVVCSTARFSEKKKYIFSDFYYQKFIKDNIDLYYDFVNTEFKLKVITCQMLLMKHH